MNIVSIPVCSVIEPLELENTPATQGDPNSGAGVQQDGELVGQLSAQTLLEALQTPQR